MNLCLCLSFAATTAAATNSKIRMRKRQEDGKYEDRRGERIAKGGRHARTEMRMTQR